MKFLLHILFIAIAVNVSAEESLHLNSQQLSELGHAFNSSQGKSEKSMVGTRIRVQVKVNKRKDGSFWAQVVRPGWEEQPGPFGINMMNFSEGFFGKMEDQAMYTIEGLIVEDRLDYGAFWTYINKYQKVDQDAGINSVTPLRDSTP